MSRERIDLSEQIMARVLPDGSVNIPWRAAEWLEQRAGVTEDRRLLLRESDPELYTALAALHLSAMSRGDTNIPGSARGPELAKCPNVIQQSKSEWLTTTEAAELAGCTPRCIRKWIAAQRLPAQRHGRDWRINRQHLHIVQALAA